MVTYAEISQGLDELIDDLQQATALSGPAIDPFELAERLQNCVLIDATLPARGCWRELGGGVASIVIAPDERDERMCFATAHEIGEQHVVDLCERLALAPEDCSERLREDLANRIASRLLVPNPWFREVALATDFDLFDLKATFRFASHQVIAWRMLDDEIPTIVTIFDNGRQSSRKTNFSGRRELLPLEKVVLERCHRHARRSEATLEGVRVQAWPIHEPAWQREILRTTVQEWE